MLPRTREDNGKEANTAGYKFAAMVVESYGAWSPSAMAVLRGNFN